MEPISLLICFLLGIVTGTVAAFFGIGGGILFVPILVLIFHLKQQEASGTSLLAIFFTSTSASIAYFRQRRVLVKVGIFLESLTIPGAIIGALFSSQVPEKTLRILFVIGAFLVGINMIVRGRPALLRELQSDMDDPSRAISVYEIKKTRVLAAGVFSFLAGMVAGAIGIGGGVIKVPIMYYLLGIPIHFAVATSSFMIMLTSAVAVLTHFELQQVVPELGITLGIGAILGAQLGARIGRRVKAAVLRRLFGVILLIVGARMLLL
ncbi:MAG: sulfite exporter TauE/SafE family protein [Candidatus Baldrarchaeia archaeon]